MKSITITDKDRLIEIMNSMSYVSARILLYIILTEKPFEPFVITLEEFKKETKVKHPALAMARLVKDGFIRKVVTGHCRVEYTLLVDLIE